MLYDSRSVPQGRQMTESDMKVSSALPVAGRPWCLVFIGASFIFACDRVSTHAQGDDVSEVAGMGGPTVLTASSSGGTGPTLTSGSPTGIVILPDVGGAGGDEGDACGVAALLEAVTRQVGGVTACWKASAMLDPDEKLGALRGAVVIDDEGRIVDITGREGDAKQRWLDEMADQRWPCLAGQTIGYACAIPD